MRREDIIKSISDNLALLQTSIQFRANLNLYDINIICEDFIRGLLNLVYNYELENLNSATRNQAGIDLGDAKRKIAVQVTSSTTRQKISSTITKFINHELYQEYDTLIVFMLQEKRKYKAFDTGGLFQFSSNDHVWDFKTILRQVRDLDTAALKNISQFISLESSRTAAQLQQLSKRAQLIPPGELGKVRVWQYRPLTFFYINVQRLLQAAANAGIELPPLSSTVDELSTIRLLPRNEYFELIQTTRLVLTEWSPTVLNPLVDDFLRPEYTGCVFEFFQTEFRPNNIKFWNADESRPKMTGDYKLDPHLHLNISNAEIYIPLNLAWMTNTTAFHSFNLHSKKTELLSGLFLLKSVSQERVAVFSPLFIGVYNLLEELEEVVMQGKREFSPRSTW